MTTCPLCCDPWPTLAELLERTSAITRYDVEELQGRHRSHRITKARRLFVRSARAAGFGVVEIAEALHRDHSTVSYLAAPGGAQ